jgi:hypothetical protein
MFKIASVDCAAVNVLSRLRLTSPTATCAWRRRRRGQCCAGHMRSSWLSDRQQVTLSRTSSTVILIKIIELVVWSSKCWLQAGLHSPFTLGPSMSSFLCYRGEFLLLYLYETLVLCSVYMANNVHKFSYYLGLRCSQWRRYRLHWRWRQYVPPKRWYLPASQHGVTTNKTSIQRIVLLFLWVCFATVPLSTRSTDWSLTVTAVCWWSCAVSDGSVGIRIIDFIGLSLTSV